MLTMYKQPELQAGLQKLVDHGAVLMEDGWTVSKAVGDWYGMGGDDVSDIQSGDGFSSVTGWFVWLWDNEYITLLGDYSEDLERVIAKFKELQPETTPSQARNNIDGLSVNDVTNDLVNAFDGHTADNYFSDGSAVTYDVTTTSQNRADKIEVVAEDAEGNQRRFVISVREAV